MYSLKESPLWCMYILKESNQITNYQNVNITVIITKYSRRLNWNFLIAFAKILTHGKMFNMDQKNCHPLYFQNLGENMTKLLLLPHTNTQVIHYHKTVTATPPPPPPHLYASNSLPQNALDRAESVCFLVLPQGSIKQICSLTVAVVFVGVFTSICYALEIQYHHVASGGLKTCGICSVLYVCVSSCNLSPRSDYNRFVLLGLYHPWDIKA